MTALFFIGIYFFGIIFGVFVCRVYEKIMGLNPFRHGWGDSLDGTGVIITIIYWPAAIFIFPLVLVIKYFGVRGSQTLDFLADKLVETLRK